MNIAQSDSKLPPGSNRCKCGACGEYFGGVYAFDMHRYGRPGHDRSCLAPSAMRDRANQPLLRLDSRGIWVRYFGKYAAKAAA